MTVYEQVRAYHEKAGDDFGRPESRVVRYDAALSLFPREYGSLLDVGCGSGRFRTWWGGSAAYTGIDLLDGVNVLDYHDQHDVVLALGVLYRVPLPEQFKLLEHMWGLANKALVVQTISKKGRALSPDEFPVDPLAFHLDACILTPKYALRTDYLSGDVTVGLYR